MKRLKQLTLWVMLFQCISCDLGLKEEIDFEEAEEFIKTYHGSFDSLDLKNLNVIDIIEIDGEFLFIENAFSGDFNGQFYSKKRTSQIDRYSFGKCHRLSKGVRSGCWIKVYGKI